MRLGAIRRTKSTQALAREVELALTNIRDAEVRTPPRSVTYTTSMDADVAGTLNEIVYCTTDSTTYVCSKTGKAGQATWSSGVSVSDHGTATGLGDDDHTQYHNDARAATWLAANHETTYTHADIALNTTHRSSNGSDHTYIDQAVTTTGDPTHNSLTLTDHLKFDAVNSLPTPVTGTIVRLTTDDRLYYAKKPP